MKSEYRRPLFLVSPIENQPLVDLGRDLFGYPQIWASGKGPACASCHSAELGWAVTDARSLNDLEKLTSQIRGGAYPAKGPSHPKGPLPA